MSEAKEAKDAVKKASLEQQSTKDQLGKAQPPDLAKLFELDPSLQPFEAAITHRYGRFAELKAKIDEHEGGLAKFSLGYETFGFNPCEEGIVYREWAPAATAVSLTGDFCDWDRDMFKCTKNEFGVWSVVIPNKPDGSPGIEEGSFVKTCITTKDGDRVERIPAWITRAVQPKGQIHYEGVYEPKTPYAWKHNRPDRPESLRIYEVASYDDYFGSDVDEEAVAYLMLANQLIHDVLPSAITVAEDVSGYPAICRPVAEGGIGFDYKLAMAVPDMWIKLLKEQADEEWGMGHIVHSLENRRYKEKSIAYAESHDQALVGDKTIAFWLMDKEMYTHMSVLSEQSAIVDRGVALHKMIRFITHALGGEGYLNFIGNEFGHPEWLDFPREGNNESYHHARRQWHLVDDDLLKYKFLFAWDREMNQLEQRFGWLHAEPAFVSCKHEDDKIIVFERAGLVFAFNFHSSKSFPDYRIGVEQPGKYKAVSSTDAEAFGGHNRVDLSADHFSDPEPWHGRNHSMLVYLPCRTATVFARVD
ncbi:starch branching enzyme II [Salpingoeca rosetta]|uniref:Starch branching enzyme II n=1 Tax=Salpingoeca rosetta (strain ATCC 50818 / BSB-021) TaxID=946362 RepID=F2TW18_SALR5|nr:starch branching enzyme II [Salpingoeca rosetta]EGD72264.1 starch branching enzyme II [Salpingoeca rosetta]|eukprot:XP_004998835.1 starch branching enzyme II [Salpingoeca rosetta]